MTERFRSRSIDGDLGSSYVSHETMTDHNNCPRQFSDCDHHREKVLEVRPLRYRVPNSEGNWGPSQAHKPWSTFNPEHTFGFFHETLDEDVDPPNFDPVDLEQIAQEWSRSSTNLAEVLATCKDTVGLIARPLSFISHMATSAKVRRDLFSKPLKRNRDVIDRAAETWLQGTYGYLPFIGDLINLEDELPRLSAILDKPKTLPKIRKVVLQSQTRSASSVPLNYDDNTWGVRKKMDVTFSRKTVITGVVNPSWETMNFATKAATYYGLRDYGRLAWELVPFSFVADWFTNIGNVVKYNGFSNGPLMYSIANAYRMTKTVRRYEEWAVWRHISQSVNISDRGLVVRESKDFSRYVMSASDPTLDIGNGLSARRFASGLALLWGNWSGISNLLRTSR